MKRASDYSSLLTYTPLQRSTVEAVIKSSGYQAGADVIGISVVNVIKLFKLGSFNVNDDTVFEVGMMYAEGLTADAISDITGLPFYGVKDMIADYIRRGVDIHMDRINRNLL